MITMQQASAAATRLSAMKYFPADDYVRAEVARALMRFVSRADQLEWLVLEMLDCVKEWPGPYELRAVFCTKFKPADGVEAYSEIAGYTPDDLEMARIESHGTRHGAMLPAARVLQIEGQRESSGPIGIAVSALPEPPNLEEDVRHGENRERLANIAGCAARPQPLYVPGTRKRTPQENAAIVEDLRRQLEARRGTSA